jgi:hypothetical protein
MVAKQHHGAETLGNLQWKATIENIWIIKRFPDDDFRKFQILAWCVGRTTLHCPLCRKISHTWLIIPATQQLDASMLRRTDCHFHFLAAGAIG